VDKDDLEPGGGQQHSMMTGSHYNNISMFDFDDNYLFLPPPEPGPSCVPCACQVFEVEPDRELDEEGEGEEEPEQGDDTYIWFWPDVGSEVRVTMRTTKSGLRIQGLCTGKAHTSWTSSGN